MFRKPRISPLFFSRNRIPDSYDECKREIWSRLGDQKDNCFKMIQRGIQQPNHQKNQNPARIEEQAGIMESLIQFLIFEVALGRSGNWSTHHRSILATL